MAKNTWITRLKHGDWEKTVVIEVKAGRVILDGKLVEMDYKNNLVHLQGRDILARTRFLVKLPVDPKVVAEIKAEYERQVRELLHEQAERIQKAVR